MGHDKSVSIFSFLHLLFFFVFSFFIFFFFLFFSSSLFLFPIVIISNQWWYYNSPSDSPMMLLMMISLEIGSWEKEAKVNRVVSWSRRYKISQSHPLINSISLTRRNEENLIWYLRQENDGTEWKTFDEQWAKKLCLSRFSLVFFLFVESRKRKKRNHNIHLFFLVSSI